MLQLGQRLVFKILHHGFQLPSIQILYHCFSLTYEFSELIITSTVIQRYIQTDKHHFSADEVSWAVNYNSAHELVAMLNV